MKDRSWDSPVPYKMFTVVLSRGCAYSSRIAELVFHSQYTEIWAAAQISMKRRHKAAYQRKKHKHNKQYDRTVTGKPERKKTIVGPLQRLEVNISINVLWRSRVRRLWFVLIWLRIKTGGRFFFKRVIKLRILFNAGHLLARIFTAIVSRRAILCSVG
jgi:hypothetical protein